MQRSCDRTGGATSFDTAAARGKLDRRVSDSAWRRECDDGMKISFLSECHLVSGWLAELEEDSWVEVIICVDSRLTSLGTSRMSKARGDFSFHSRYRNGLQCRSNRQSAHLRSICLLDRRSTGCLLALRLPGTPPTPTSSDTPTSLQSNLIQHTPFNPPHHLTSTQ